MKRILTLIGAIMGIVYSAICASLTLIFFLALCAFLSTPNAAVIIIGVFACAIGVVALVLDILATRCFACNATQYTKRRKMLIATIVFNLVPSSALLFVFFAGMAEIYLFLPVIILGIVSAALLIADLYREKNRIGKISDTTPPTLTEQAQQ